MRGRLTLTASIGAELQITGVLADVIYGVAYSATLGQFGGVGLARYTCTSTLPVGITFGDNGDGTCTFTTAGTTDSGDFPVTVKALDAERTNATRSFVLRVMVLPITLTGDAGDMRIGDAPDTFSYGVSGGSGIYTNYAIGSGALPPGWTLDPGTGLVARTATAAGAYAWTIVVTDSLGNTSAGYADSCTVRYPLITLTGSFASLGIIGVPYSSDITITGGDGTYSNQRFTLGAVSGMALSIVTVSGVKKLRLSGVPTTHETDSITVAVDAHEFDGSTVTATHSQSVTEDPALTLTGTFTATGGTGVSYQSDLLLGGGDGTFALGNGGTGLAPGSGALPAGSALSIVTVSGSKYLRLSGVLTTAGANAFNVSVNSGDGQNVTSAQSVTVAVVYSYLRFLINTQGTVGYTAISKLQFLTAVGGTDITAAGGTATDNGHYASNYAAAYAFDNDVNTFYHTPGGGTYYIQFVPNVPGVVTAVTVRTRPDGTGWTYGPQAFSVQGSNDGSSWTTIWSVSGIVWTSPAGQTQTFVKP